MVKAKKGNMLIFGLSDMNIKKLKENQPIKFNLQELGLPNYEVVIFHGKDEEAMYEMMKDSISKEHTVFEDHRQTKDN